MDYKKILRNTKDKNKLKVTLKNTKEKGVGLFARETIKKGEVIAYYKVRIFLHRTYESSTDNVYIFEIYRKNGEAYKKLIGDIEPDDIPKPINHITFWAPFANEPSSHQKTNAEIDINLEGNYVNKTYSSPGESAIYKLIASRMIRPDEEILWYYGERYTRNYLVGKEM